MRALLFKCSFFFDINAQPLHLGVDGGVPVGVGAGGGVAEAVGAGHDHPVVDGGHGGAGHHHVLHRELGLGGGASKQERQQGLGQGVKGGRVYM